MSKHSFFTALKWSFAGEIASKAVQPLIFIVLARLLTPGDYGVMAAALMVITFTQVFWDAGMGRAVIQWQKETNVAANAGFWINITLAIVIGITIFLTAPLLSTRIFHDERVTNVLRVMIIQVVLGSLSSIHVAILQKEMKFSLLFWVRLCTIAIPGLFSIPLALYGWSYWALVTGTLTGQLAQVITLWIISKWKPKFQFDVVVAKELGRFGFWVCITGLLVWFYLWADSFIVGASLGTTELGLFRTANTVVVMIFDNLLFGPVLPVIYSYFSGLAGNLEKIRTVCEKILKIICIIGIPAAFLLYAIAEPISHLIFGEKWSGIGYIIGIIAIMRGYGWMVGINGDTYRAVGKPHLETSVYAFCCLFFLAGYIISIQYGMKVFLITRLCLGILALVPHFYLFRRLFRLPLVPIFRTVFICSVAGLIPVAIMYLLGMPQTMSLLLLVGVSTVALVLMGFVIFLLERKFITSVANELRMIFTKKTIEGSAA